MFDYFAFLLFIYLFLFKLTNYVQSALVSRGRKCVRKCASNLCFKAALLVARPLGREKDGDNQPVQTKRLREDEDQHHGDVHARLLRSGTHTAVTHNPDGHPSAETRKTHRKTAPKVKERRKKSVPRLDYKKKQTKGLMCVSDVFFCFLCFLL